MALPLRIMDREGAIILKRLCELVDVVSNNEECVVFRPKDGSRMDLISLGCFNGNEELIRMTKGRTPEITIFYDDGKSFSYHFGEGSTTCISGSFLAQREMIRECAILDFGIVCDWSYTPNDINWSERVRATMKNNTLADVTRLVTLVSGGGMVGNIRINEQTIALNVHAKDVQGWFEQRGYHVDLDEDISNGFECGKLYGFCEPLREFQVAEMPYELSENRLVRYVQEQLFCDKDAATEFLNGLNEARLICEAQDSLLIYRTEIDEAGIRVRNLSSEDLLALGKKLSGVDSRILTDCAEAEIAAVLSFLHSHQKSPVSEVLEDAVQRSGVSNSLDGLDKDKEFDM